VTTDPHPPTAVCLIRVERRTETDLLVAITVTPEIGDPRRARRAVTTDAAAALGIVASFLREAGVPPQRPG
jgi:hypothetical protein